MIVQIKDGRKKTYFKRNELYCLGFRFNNKSKLWFKKEYDNSAIEYYKMYARKNQLTIRVFQDGFVRSYDYRKKFFENTKPQIKGKYFCSYCGALLEPDEVSVDHIIPVVKAQRNPLAKWLLEKNDITDINDLKNLAPACLECNTKKGKKIGLWTLRGFLGKNKWFWLIGYTLFIVFAICIFSIGFEVLKNG